MRTTPSHRPCAVGLQQGLAVVVNVGHPKQLWKTFLAPCQHCSAQHQHPDLLALVSLSQFFSHLQAEEGEDVTAKKPSLP
mmetsp:Transcript_45721/g.106124  ORF Transcript_45721/g.106124 Transcript_45721/m.106124 type:complete len:80 (-) Transcript_45721:2562-2801(-)